MSPTGGLTRRQLLAYAGASGGAALLSACSTRVVRARTSPSPVASPLPTPAPSSGVGLESLSAELSSPLLRPGAAEYASAARLYNPVFDAASQPAAIAQCRSAADVAACVRFAAARGDQSLRLRAGGHSYGGWSSGPGLVADVRAMRSVTVDRAQRMARVGAGVRLIDLYSQLGAAGTAVAAGSCPTVGLTGLALGGGVGVLTRAYGLTCDAIQSVQLVTADGRLREVTARRDPDLFWALRGGGGGSFGAVTALTLAVRPSPTMHRFFLSWDSTHAEAVVRAWQRWMAHADPRLWSTCKLLARAQKDGLSVTVAGTWIGPAADLRAQLQPLLAEVQARPDSQTARTAGYVSTMLSEAGCGDVGSAEECAASALSPARRQPFAATSAFLPSALPEDGITAVVRAARTGLGLPGVDEAGISFDALGGRVSAVPADETAFAYRDALATIQYTATWAAAAKPSASPASRFVEHVQSLRSALLPWTRQTAYVNYADPSISDYGPAYWSGHYPRLRDVKKAYDPGGLFDFPQAVRAQA